MSGRVPCPSPARLERTDSSSSRESGFSLQLDFDSGILNEPLHGLGMIRPSSWDESDDDSLPEHEPSRLYSNDGNSKGSIANEINELKKQFFETLEKMKEGCSPTLENSTNKAEDRRHCPARIRRRTKSSSSLSPVLETKNQNLAEKLCESDTIFDEVSSKTSEVDPKFYLNTFFNELRSKRISLTDSVLVGNKLVEEESNQSGKCIIPMINDLTNQDSNENDGYFCKTSRKLSQIIEVEENRKDLEKSSEEALENSDFYSKSLKKSEENFSPLPTSRSRSENISDNLKLRSSENVEDLQKLPRPFQGSLSDRSKLVHKPNDNFSFQLPKSAKERLSSPDWLDDKHSKDGFKVVCFNSQLETDKNFSEKSNSKDDEKENNFDSLDSLKINLMKNSGSENPTPKSPDWSELSRTTRTRSGKSRNSFSGSPKLKLNIEKDSARSLKVEDVNTPDSQWKREIEIESRPRTVSFEDCSPRKSKRSPDRSETSIDPKSERNLQIPLDSSSLESVKSSSCSSKELDMNSSKSRTPKSIGGSQRKKEKVRKTSEYSDLKESMNSCSSLRTNRSYRKSLENSRIESPAEENENIETPRHENQFKRSSKTSHTRSSRSSRSDKTNSPKTAKERSLDHSSDLDTSRYNKIPELELPLDISESQKSSCRSEKTPELKNVPNNSVRSDIKTSKRSSRRSSERSSSSQSKSTDSKKRTPKITPRTIDSISSRSKDDLENQAEIESTDFAWAELKKMNDILSSRTSSASHSSWKERKKSSQESSPQRGSLSPGLDDSRITGRVSPENITFSEKRRSTSGKSSRRSLDSFVIESTRNNSPTKSIKAKFSPHFLKSEEGKTSDHHSGIEKLYSEVANKITSSKILTFPEEEEDVKENYASQTLKNDSESDRYSEKRLSIINEVSFEDLEISNESNEENEGSSREQSRGSSKRKSRELSSQRFYQSTKSTPKTSKSQKHTSNDESTYQQNELAVGEKWNELIEAFRESPNSSFILENTFSMLPNRKDTIRENMFTGRESLKNQNSVFSTRITVDKHEVPEKHFSFESKTEKKEEDLKNSNLEYEEHLLEKPLKKNIRTFQNFQNLYYTNVYERKPFGIGECGDVSFYNTDKFDASEKPKDHGDGSSLQNTSEILAFFGKREKEVKTQRHLWTDLKGDFRNAKEKLNKLLIELEDQNYSTDIVPIDLKKSKSDNCIVRKNENNDFKISSVCDFKTQSTLKLENCRDTPAEKDTTEHHFSIDSLENEKGTVGNEEFDCEITPRLSKSMIDLDSELEKENFEEVELNNYNSSRSQLFERTSETSKGEKEITNLNIFLARNQKKDKTAVKPNNWLNFKALEVENFHKKGKKSKKKRKDVNSPKDKHQGYLSTRKSRSSIPQLKLRNPNCFQSFYKRIIGVFCLTSHSSAATSK